MDRNQEIVRLRTEERLALEEIGARFGITRERVRQILANHGVSGHRRCANPRCARGTNHKYCHRCTYRLKTYGRVDFEPLPARLPEGTPCPYCMKRPARPYVAKCRPCTIRERYQEDPEFRSRRQAYLRDWVKKKRSRARHSGPLGLE